MVKNLQVLAGADTSALLITLTFPLGVTSASWTSTAGDVLSSPACPAGRRSRTPSSSMPGARRGCSLFSAACGFADGRAAARNRDGDDRGRCRRGGHATQQSRVRPRRVCRAHTRQPGHQCHPRRSWTETSPQLLQRSPKPRLNGIHRLAVTGTQIFPAQPFTVCKNNHLRTVRL